MRIIGVIIIIGMVVGAAKVGEQINPATAVARFFPAGVFLFNAVTPGMQSHEDGPSVSIAVIVGWQDDIARLF